MRLDGKTVGTTPMDFRFTHYGVRRITLYKPGYRTYSEQIELDPPWYGHFPIDIVSEVLFPIGWTDRRRYHVALEQGEEVMSTPSLRSVIERADVLRNAGPEGPRGLPELRPLELPAGQGDEQEEP